MRARACTIGLVATALVGLVWARPSQATWTSVHCHGRTHIVSGLRRVDARTYARRAAWEGYEWGGGCWNNDNRDDTPRAPDSGGEGPDCSGLVFKTWGLRLSYATSGFRWWGALLNVHGPYTAASFHSAASNLPFHDLSSKTRYATTYMDAFASVDHIGLIWSNAVPSQGGDYIIEAYNDASGTGVNIEDYRADAAFRAVRREGWMPDCAPRCSAGSLRPDTVAIA